MLIVARREAFDQGWLKLNIGGSMELHENVASLGMGA